MFSMIGSWFDNALGGYVATVIAALTVGLVAIALAAVTIYIANYGYAIVRGEAQEPLDTFVWKMAKIVMICSVALGPALYMSLVFETADGAQNSMSMFFIRPGAYGGATPTTVFGALDAADTRANELLRELLKDMGFTRPDLFLAAIIFCISNGIFFTAGLVMTVYSKVVMAFTLAVGPISILTLIFRPTAKFFDAWLAMLWSAIVLTWFVFFALGVSFFVTEQVIRMVVASGAFSSTGTVNAVTAALGYGVIVCALALLLWQSARYAGALTGGPAVHAGGALAAGFLMSQALRRGSGGSNSAPGGGGSIRQQTDSGYLNTATQAGSSAARGVARGVTAAFQRIAQRGSSR